MAGASSSPRARAPGQMGQVVVLTRDLGIGGVFLSGCLLGEEKRKSYALRYYVEVFIVVEDVGWLRGVDVDMPATMKKIGWWCACDVYIAVRL